MTDKKITEIERDTEYAQTLGEGLETAEKGGSTSPLVDTLTLATGVVLRFKAISPQSVIDVMNTFVPPKVPVVWDEEREREIENPEHPEYLEAMRKFQSRQGFAMYDTAVALGVTVDTIPEGFEGPDGEDWIDTLEMLGIVFNRDKKAVRKLMWLKHIAITGTVEMERIVVNILRRSGVTEEDVQVAAAGFRRDTPRDTDPTVSNKE